MHKRSVFKRAGLFWFLAVVITVAAVIYQRKTGPTYPLKAPLVIGGKTIVTELPRSHSGNTDCMIELGVPGEDVSGKVFYRRYPTRDEWTSVPLQRRNDLLEASLPHQPPAGKLEYRIELERNGESYNLNKGNSIIIRFRGDVPAGIMIPHIILMFGAMLLSNVAGIMAFFRHRKYRFYGYITIVVLFIGGLIFGPWVQWHAFGDAWTGVPFAWDLTDNKTLLAFLFWLLAILMNRKKERPVYIIIASLVMLLVYSIPHSLYGSELDPETGRVIQGFINLKLASCLF